MLDNFACFAKVISRKKKSPLATGGERVKGLINQTTDCRQEYRGNDNYDNDDDGYEETAMLLMSIHRRDSFTVLRKLHH